MAKKRTLGIDTTNGQGEALKKVITTYAHAAYPVGGSDCAAATRQALLDVADKLLTSEMVDISARQRPMLKSAVSWYFTEVEKSHSDMQEMLLTQLVRKKT
ncbi:MAG: Unknown protein [uncultured Thiotrichaceae bacterium]|uniref:Uncharacterized protein n=1 Tax=uncultured Thiotrichaceae bacterium TaxID=298394 RepID=A0A6S6UFF7_9GAMM|nr:MAG: Unknown protein [uncultured Thiotrichaceae bacterium]